MLRKYITLILYVCRNEKVKINYPCPLFIFTLPDASFSFLLKHAVKCQWCYGTMVRSVTLEHNVREWGVHGSYSHPQLRAGYFRV